MSTMTFSAFLTSELMHQLQLVADSSPMHIRLS